MSPVLARLTVREEVGVARHGEVVVAGVFVPPGELDAADRLAVRGADGTVRGAQQLAEQRSADGTVGWVSIAFPVDCPAGGSVELGVVRVADAEPAADPVTVSGADEVSVAWSGQVARFGAGQHLLLPGRLVPGGVAADATLEGTTAPARVESVEVVHAGPLLAELELRGRYVAQPPSSAGSAGLVARVRIVSGTPGVRLAVSIIADAEPDRSDLARWRVTVGTGPVRRATVGAFRRAASAIPPLAVGHAGGGHPRGIFAVSDVTGGTDWRDESEPGYHDRWEWAELHGPVAQNWLVTQHDDGDRTTAVERLCEQHPATVRCERDRVLVDLFDGSASTAALARGSAPRRILTVSAGADRRAGAQLDHPLVGFDADALNHARPEVLPHLPTELPNLEALIRTELFGWYQSGQSLGFYDHGDGMQGIPSGPRLGYSSNNEHDTIYALLLHYLRTGERAYLDSAIAYGDHTVDIDRIHVTAHPHELGGVRAHGRAHVHYVDARSSGGTVRTSIDTGHMWVEGLILLTQVSGDSRYLDAAVGVGECLLRLEQLGWTRPEPGPRNAGWPLIALSALARATGEHRFLDAATRIAESAIARQAADGRWLMRLGFLDDYCAWQNAVLITGLHRLAELTGADEPAAAVERGGRAMLDLGRTPEGTFVYLTRYDYRWTQRSGLVREALACLYEATKDPEFLTAGLLGGARWYPATGRPRVTSEDIAEWRGHLPFLGGAYRAGLLEDLP